MEKSVPTGVKVLAILNYIGAALTIILALIFFFGAGAIGSLADKIPGLGVLGAGVFIVLGIVMLGLGVLSIFIGRGLWKGQNWARIVSIIFLALGIISSISYIIGGKIMSGIIYLIIYAAIAAYLLFNKKVKQAFA